MSATRTYGDVYGPAMKIKTKAEADAFIEREWPEMKAAHPEWSDEYCKDVVRSNAVYWSGYYDDETRRRIEPIFGRSLTSVHAEALLALARK